METRKRRSERLSEKNITPKKKKNTVALKYLG